MLLFFSIPRRNTNEIAHDLLERFGSLHGVLNASPQELKEVRGVGPQTVYYLRSMSDLIARYQEESVNKRRLLSSKEAMETYLSSLFVGCYTEKLYLLLFNGSERLVLTEQVGDGMASFCEFSPTRITHLAAKYGAGAAILAHNHPNGIPEPSFEDIKTTKRIQEALEMVGVTLLDHLIVTDDEVVSVWHNVQLLP